MMVSSEPVSDVDSKVFAFEVFVEDDVYGVLVEDDGFVLRESDGEYDEDEGYGGDDAFVSDPWVGESHELHFVAWESPWVRGLD